MTFKTTGNINYHSGSEVLGACKNHWEQWETLEIKLKKPIQRFVFVMGPFHYSLPTLEIT